MFHAIFYWFFFIITILLQHQTYASRNRREFQFNRPRLTNSVVLNSTPLINKFFSQYPSEILSSSGETFLTQQPHFLQTQTQPIKTNSFGSNYGFNIIPPVNTYIINGRILSQYEVHEPNDETNNIYDMSTYSTIPSGSQLQLPYTFQTSFDHSFLTKFPNFLLRPNVQFQRANLNNLNPPKPPPPIFGRNHGPIALGSGSLGYIRLPGGGVYIGSGSLGYTSEKQHIDTLIKQKQVISPSPLIFGHGGK